ncbi:MAG: hypothetical protein HYR56_12830 [Acidobacteria bacterium]|nr:hypothetical protein [Acidobacteriota bacterium]MBI3424250.1 hypothetical protein [Acidobacteriota bacterium]
MSDREISPVERKAAKTKNLLGFFLALFWIFLLPVLFDYLPLSVKEIVTNEHWQMLCIGVLLIVFGIFMTHVRGAMPGSTSRGPVPLRMRLILIFFGVFMIVLAVARLLHQ